MKNHVKSVVTIELGDKFVRIPVTTDHAVFAARSLALRYGIDTILESPYERLTRLRQRANLTKSELAKALRLALTSLISMEAGRRPIGKKWASKFGKLFGRPAEEFLFKPIKTK